MEKREGIYVYLWLIHVVIWQKLTQQCKAIICQLKKIFLRYVNSCKYKVNVLQ